MSILDGKISHQLKDLFKKVANPVHILYFGKNGGCVDCENTRQLIEEVASLSEKISTSINNIQLDRETSGKYEIDRAPTIIIAGKDDDDIIDYGIRFIGLPSGHEFSSFINALILVSQRDSGLSEQSREFISNLKEQVTLQVFVTPT